MLSEQTRKDIDRAFEALTDIGEISNALAAVMEYECCLYGFNDAYKLAKKWQREADNDSKTNVASCKR